LQTSREGVLRRTAAGRLPLMRSALQPIRPEKSNGAMASSGAPKPSWLTAKTPTDIAPNLETDIRVGVIAEIHAAEIEGTGRKQVGTSVLRVVANRGGSGRDFFMLALLVDGIGRCRKHEERGKAGSGNSE